MKNFDFGDINLVPKFFDGVSRADLDTSVELGGRKFKLPAIPANMESVITEELCMKLAENGYFYIMHRFNIDQKEFIKKMHSKNLIASISLGVKEADLKLAEELVEEGLIPEYLTIDIAHGHSLMMKNALEHYRKLFPDTFIIAGNIATKDAGLDLMKWGADCVKMGVGPGNVCFVDGTKVLTDTGYKNIEDIRIGEKVLTHDGTYKEVINYISYIDNEEKIKINDIISTPNHKYYVVNKSQLNEITDDNYTDYAYFLEASKLDKNIHMLVSIGVEQTTNKKIKFIEINNIEKININTNVNDLTVKDNHSYTVLSNNNNIAVHNCTTYMETGFGTRLMQASKIKEISSLPIPIIADGGISTPGAIAKALVLGAHMCMCGNIFSGYKDSPGKWVTIDGKHYKEYYGSASAYNTGKNGRIEGTKKLVEYKDITLLERCVQIEESLQSAISYGGGKNLKDLLRVKYEFNK